MPVLPSTVLHAPPLHRLARNGTVVLLDPGAPAWLATDERGAGVLALVDGHRSADEIARAHAGAAGLDLAKAWVHVETILSDGLRHGLLAEAPPAREAYEGRASSFRGDLREVWLHVNDACNLRCAHCLVSSGPEGDRGLPTEAWLRLIEEARALGVTRFHVTGGEPFLRRDLEDLLEAATRDDDAEVHVLTNGMAFTAERLARARDRARGRLRLQVSLDGASAATNDALRGEGSFPRILEGVRLAVAAGLDPTVSTAISAGNVADVPAVTRLVGSLGARRHHLLWLHARGRAVEGGRDLSAPVAQVLAAVRAARDAGSACGVEVDNVAAYAARVEGPRGRRFDLSNAGWDSLCVHADGEVYPSAALARDPALRCGNAVTASLRSVWEDGAVLAAFRRATLARKPRCVACPYRFLCGGGDLEHAYAAAGGASGAGLDAALAAHDPFCDLHAGLLESALLDAADAARAARPRGIAFDAPLALRAMGDRGTSCADTEEEAEGDGAVRTLHSNCVADYDVDRSRALVRRFYGAAAVEPRPELCCPVRYAAEEVAHVPQEVLDRFYGCGSPIAAASVAEGETTLDLGCGAGIDVFVCARKVGPGGRAIGVDMTDEMLTVARANAPVVARNLGWDVADFRRGFLEEIPAEDASVDLVTSNCVVNLSPDKPRVFREIRRVLKDHGRLVLSDIVCESEVPPSLRVNAHLWGECVAGALSEAALLALLERTGFHGVEVGTRCFWREVEGLRFHSVTVRARRFAKQGGCAFVGQTATYLGPMKAVVDEEGHLFPRGSAVPVCTDTAARLLRPPYAGRFRVVDGEGADVSPLAPSADVPADACCADGACS